MINERLIDSYEPATLVKALGDTWKLMSLVELRLQRAIKKDVKTGDLAFIDAVDGYIAKMLLENPDKLDKKVMAKYHDELYKMYRDNINKGDTRICYDSILFRKDIAKLFFSEEEYKNIMLHKHRDAKDIYDRYQNLIKMPNMFIDTDILRFAIFHIGNETPAVVHFLDSIYKYLITYRMNNNQYYAKEFILKYTSYLAAKDMGVEPPSVYVSNYKLYDQEMIPDNFGSSYGNTGIITINKNSLLKNHRLHDDLPGLYNYIMIVAHETKHSKQASDSANGIISLAGFEQFRYGLFDKYLSSADYNEYHSNYTHSGNEVDAYRYGWYFLYKMASKYNPQDKENLDKISSKRIKDAYQEVTPTKINHSINKHEEACKYNVWQLDNIVQAHPKLLKNHFVKLLYKDNGEIRSLLELIELENSFTGSERDEVEKIFKDYYTYAVYGGELERIEASKLDREKQFLLFRKVASLLTDEYEYLKNSIQVYNKFENKVEFRKKEFSFVCERRLVRIQKLTDYLNRNHALIEQLRSIDVSEGNRHFLGLSFMNIDRMRDSLYKYLPKLSDYDITEEKLVNNIKKVTEYEYTGNGRGSR